MTKLTSKQSYYRNLLFIAIKADEALKAENPREKILEIRKIAYKALDSYQYRKLLEEAKKQKKSIGTYVTDNLRVKLNKEVKK